MEEDEGARAKRSRKGPEKFEPPQGGASASKKRANRAFSSGERRRNAAFALRSLCVSCVRMAEMASCIVAVA